MTELANGAAAFARAALATMIAGAGAEASLFMRSVIRAVSAGSIGRKASRTAYASTRTPATIVTIETQFFGVEA